MPYVSVIMPTYNTDSKMLDESTASILKQSFRDFEFIIIDDGSPNYCNYEHLSKSINDTRVLIYKNDCNMGVSYTLNKAIDLCRGEFIVRMDADDISLNNRLALLIDFMENNPQISVAGSYAVCFGAKNNKMKYPITNEDIRAEMLFNNPFCHPTVIFRKKVIDRYNLRYPQNLKNEDFAMWLQMSQIPEINFANIPIVLLKYRIHPQQVTNKTSDGLKTDSITLYKRVLFSFGIQGINDNYLRNYVCALNNDRKLTTEEYASFIDVCKSVLELVDNDHKAALQRAMSIKNKKIVIKQMIKFRNKLKLKTDFVSGNTGNLLLDFLYCIIP